MFKVVLTAESGSGACLEYWCHTRAEANYLCGLKPNNSYIIDETEEAIDA